MEGRKFDRKGETGYNNEENDPVSFEKYGTKYIYFPLL
jgi:hypothetical protein